MKRNGYWLYLLLFLIFSLLCADNTVKELQKKLTSASGKEKIAILNKLAFSYLSDSPQKAIDTAERAVELSEKLNFPAGEAAALNNIVSGYIKLWKNEKALPPARKALTIYEKIADKKGMAASLKRIGIIYRNLNDLQKGLDYYLKLLPIERELGNKSGEAAALGNIGIFYANLGTSHKALRYYREAAEKFEEIGNKRGVAASLNNIGVIYWELGDYDRALESHLQSLRIEEETGNKLGMANNRNSIGNVYSKLEKFDKALVYYREALILFKELGNKRREAICLSNIGTFYEDTGNNEKALEYYRKSLEIGEEIDDKRGISISLNNMGVVYRNLGEYEKALSYYIKSLKIDEEGGDKHSAALSFQNIGEIYIKLKQYAAAQSYFEQSLKIAKELKIKDLTSDIYQNWSELFALKKEFKKAYECFKMYTEVNDEILNKESNDRIAELQSKYETGKKEREIILLQKNNELLIKDNKIRGITRDAFIAAFALVLIIVLLLFKKYLHLFAFWKRKSYIGHYRILDKIGSGGMGIVYKASHVMAGSKPVAIKVIREEYSKDPTQRKRFLNEALLVDQLNHPNIVKVFERGEHNEQLFIAMELLEGQSLAELIQEGEHISLQDCLKIMAQLVDAVSKIHAKGIVHRDLKPENILLVEQDGEKNFVKLLDFGLAKSASLTRLTETGEILGTINYLPPERITNQEYSPAGDIYSLGVVFYELVTREKPFLGETPLDVIKQILEKEPIEPIRLRPGIPGELNALILKMMSLKPGERPKEEILIEAITSFRNREGN